MRTTAHSPFLIACVAGFLTFSGCLDITSTSTVSSDGSIVRTITFTGDSAEVCRRDYPILLDTLWTTTITRLSPTSEKDFTLTARRTFRDAAEMNKVLGGTFGRSLQERFEFDKSFDWFFIVFRYRETTLPYAQYTSIPMSDYLSRQEISLIEQDTLDDAMKRFTLSRGDSLAMESFIPRYTEWESRNRFEPVFKAFLDGVKMVNDPLLTTGQVAASKELLYQKSEHAIEKGKTDSLRTIFKNVLRTPLVDKALEANKQAFRDIEHKFEFEEMTNSHKYITNVVMPGIITGSNARKIEGNTATWQDYREFARHFEFTMWVESRRVNWGGVVIAGILVASLVAALVLSNLRRRSRA
jgi:hypothetical protein